MFDLSMGIWEFVLRAAIVYLFLFAMLRLGGKKHVGELTPFDFVVLLIISETVQGSMIGDDKSLIGGLIAASHSVRAGLYRQLPELAQQDRGTVI